MPPGGPDPAASVAVRPAFRAPLPEPQHPRCHLPDPQRPVADRHARRRSPGRRRLVEPRARPHALRVTRPAQGGKFRRIPVGLPATIARRHRPTVQPAAGAAPWPQRTTYRESGTIMDAKNDEQRPRCSRSHYVPLGYRRGATERTRCSEKKARGATRVEQVAVCGGIRDVRIGVARGARGNVHLALRPGLRARQARGHCARARAAWPRAAEHTAPCRPLRHFVACRSEIPKICWRDRSARLIRFVKRGACAPRSALSKLGLAARLDRDRAGAAAVPSRLARKMRRLLLRPESHGPRHSFDYPEVTATRRQYRAHSRIRRRLGVWEPCGRQEPIVGHVHQQTPCWCIPPASRTRSWCRHADPRQERARAGARIQSSRPLDQWFPFTLKA